MHDDVGIEINRLVTGIGVTSTVGIGTENHMLIIGVKCSLLRTVEALMAWLRLYLITNESTGTENNCLSLNRELR